MTACIYCDGSGKCPNSIHIRGSGSQGEVLAVGTGGSDVCNDCGDDADSPGDCIHCGGTGES